MIDRGAMREGMRRVAGHSRAVRSRTRAALVALLVAVPCLAAPASAPAAPLATITGSVAEPTGAFAQYLRPVVNVYRLDPGYEAYSVPVSHGRYRLSAPAGVYAVVETTWRTVRGKAISAPSVAVLLARPGATGNALLRPPGLRSFGTPEPGGPRVSVGQIQLLGRGDSRPEIEGGLINTLGEAPCTAYTVEDARYGNYGAILKEVRLKATSAVRPEDRASLQDALATLRAWRATYRLMGNITVVDGRDDGRAEGSFRLVRLDTDTTVWTADIAVERGGFDALRQRVSNAVARFVCKFPERIRVDVDHASPIGSATLTWRATWDLEFQRLKGYAGGLTVVTYQATSTQVRFWNIAYSGDCTGSASWPGGPIADPQGLVNLRYRSGARSYSLNLRWQGPAQPVSVACSGQNPRLESPLTGGEMKSRELEYTKFPIRGTNDRPPPVASWTVYDMTPSR